jgi:Flp pilus assembly protein TadD
VADLVDDDPWRRRLRGAAGRRAVLEGLAEEEGARGQPPTNIVLLVRALKDAGSKAAASRLLRGVQAARPADFWINFALARSFHEELDAAERLRFYQAALALRPQSPAVHNNLGKTLFDKGDVDGAIAEFREAIRLKYDYADAHSNLGVALLEKGQPDEAIAELQEAIRLKKDYASAHSNLGSALQVKGRVDEAIAEFREALRLNNEDAEAHCNLGDTLMNKGLFREAVEELRRGAELGSRYPRWPHAKAAEGLIRNAERMARLDDRLPNVLEGKDRPKEAAEYLDFARLCYLYRKQYVAAARLYGEAIAAEPAVVASPANGRRYNAACAAALAGCGAGEAGAKLNDAESAGLRRQALEWLRADLDAWRSLLDKEPDKIRPKVAQQMQHWLRDADFNGVRGPDALAKLREAERVQWQKLWADVAATEARAQEKGTPAKK